MCAISHLGKISFFEKPCKPQKDNLINFNAILLEDNIFETLLQLMISTRVFKNIYFIATFACIRSLKSDILS